MLIIKNPWLQAWNPTSLKLELELNLLHNVKQFCKNETHKKFEQLLIFE